MENRHGHGEQYKNALNDNRSFLLVLCWKSEPSKIVGNLMVVVNHKTARIDNLMTSPEVRGFRLGSIILKYALSVIDNSDISRTILVVRPSNITAKRIYEKFGFTDTRRSANYYHHPAEDGIYMNRVKL